MGSPRSQAFGRGPDQPVGDPGLRPRRLSLGTAWTNSSSSSSLSHTDRYVIDQYRYVDISPVGSVSLEAEKWACS